MLQDIGLLTVVRLPHQVDILARAHHPGIVANTNYLIRARAHQNVGEFLVVLLVGFVVDIDDFHVGYGMIAIGYRRIERLSMRRAMRRK